MIFVQNLINVLQVQVEVRRTLRVFPIHCKMLICVVALYHVCSSSRVMKWYHNMGFELTTVLNNLLYSSWYMLIFFTIDHEYVYGEYKAEGSHYD